MENYTKLLKSYNLKVTPQRLEIVQQLDLRGHMSIENLYSILLKKFPSISLATIYKNINAMLDNLFVQEVKIPNEKSVYELTKGHHSHLVCTECKSVEDITIDVNDLVKVAEEKSKFKINDSNFVFSGVCAKCATHA